MTSGFSQTWPNEMYMIESSCDGLCFNPTGIFCCYDIGWLNYIFLVWSHTRWNTLILWHLIKYQILTMFQEFMKILQVYALSQVMSHIMGLERERPLTTWAWVAISALSSIIGALSIVAGNTALYDLGISMRMTASTLIYQQVNNYQWPLLGCRPDRWA